MVMQSRSGRVAVVMAVMSRPSLWPVGSSTGVSTCSEWLVAQETLSACPGRPVSAIQARNPVRHARGGTRSATCE